MEDPMAVPIAVTALWATVVLLVVIITHIAFALAVLREAGNMASTELVGGGMWALATLAGGVFVAAVFWLVHNLPVILQTRNRRTVEPAPPE